MEPIWVMGLMSGTSLDGIDAALILTDGKTIYDKGESLYIPYPIDFQGRLKKVLGKKTAPQEIIDESTNYHIQAVKQLLLKTNHPVKLVGYHGQTIFHDPPFTLQIGDAIALATACEIDVVYDFRTDDCLAGGQGAPLVPIYHQALMRHVDHPVAVINIGGVANMTYVDGNVLIAGDVGPGNALINDVVQEYFELPYDTDGQIALANISRSDMVEDWLRDPFFTQPFPKSLDRDHFHPNINILDASVAVATLTEFTIAAIRKSYELLPLVPKKVYLCGGGAKNQAIIQGLAPCEILPNADMIEAEAFAYLAVRVLYGLPTSFPDTTGCQRPTSGGKIIFSSHL